MKCFVYVDIAALLAVYSLGPRGRGVVVYEYYPLLDAHDPVSLVDDDCDIHPCHIRQIDLSMLLGDGN